MISTSNLTIGFKQGKKKIKLLENINLKSNRNELIAVIGRNGVGKSTLLKTLIGLYESLAGKISIGDRELLKYSRIELAKLVSFVSTQMVAISNLKVKELVELGRYPYTNWSGFLSDEDKMIAQQAMHLTGIENYAYKNIGEISDGERQKAMIARALSQNTKIMVLDEPTAFLDIPNRYEVVKLLHQLSDKQKKTIIFSTHDMNIALEEADKIWFIHDGDVIEGSPEDLIIKKEIHKLFNDSSLEFSFSDKQIKLKREKKYKIRLSGQKDAFDWTQKALERIGFQIDNNFMDIRVEIILNNDIFAWNLFYKEKEYSFNSIYELIYRLKNINT